MKDLTKKQQKAAAKLIVGCVAMYGEFGLDGCNITENDIQNVSNEIVLLAYKILGEHESFPSTAEIIEYVRKNF